MSVFHCGQLKTTYTIIRTFIMSVLDFQRKITNIQSPPFTHNQATLNHISQFTDVPFPRLLFQRFQKSGSHLIDGIREFFRETFGESSRKNPDITGTFTKRRKMHLKNRKTIKQVFTEMPGFDLLLQIPVGSSNDTHIDSCRLGITDLYIFSRFKDTQ